MAARLAQAAIKEELWTENQFKIMAGWHSFISTMSTRCVFFPNLILFSPLIQFRSAVLAKSSNTFFLRLTTSYLGRWSYAFLVWFISGEWKEFVLSEVPHSIPLGGQFWIFDGPKTTTTRLAALPQKRRSTFWVIPSEIVR